MEALYTAEGNGKDCNYLKKKSQSLSNKHHIPVIRFDKNHPLNSYMFA